MKKRVFGLMITLLAVTIMAASAAPIRTETQAFGKTGEKLPRFASLSSDEVNMRTGPDKRYPIEWVYRRRGLPVEIVDEYYNWRKIRDMEGTEGWVSKDLLTSTRTGMVTGDRLRTLFAQAKPNAKALWRAEPGVVAEVIACEDAWCEIRVEDKRGWILRGHLWGVEASENFR